MSTKLNPAFDDMLSQARAVNRRIDMRNRERQAMLNALRASRAHIVAVYGFIPATALSDRVQSAAVLQLIDAILVEGGIDGTQ